MKAVFIAYNQANTERIDYLLDKLEIRGFTQWVDVNGRGTETGNPQLGTHTWPEKNSAVLTIVPDEKVELYGFVSYHQIPASSEEKKETSYLSFSSK